MAYIGKSPVIGNFVKLDAITAVNGQAAYTMQNSSANFTDYSSVNQFMVSLNGTIQSPGSSFTVSGSTITFASNLVTNDVIDFIIVFGNSLSSGVPTDATVSTAKIVDDAVTAAKLNNNVISGQTELASEPADTDEFLVSDAGTIKRIDYSLIKGGGITEFDMFRLTTSFQGNSTPISSNLERCDTHSFEKIGTGMTESSGIFTFPSTGKYHVIFTLRGKNSESSGERHHQGVIRVTTDGTNYTDAAQTANNIGYYSSSANNFQSSSTSIFIDVTNTSTHKVSFDVYASGNSNTYTTGSTGLNDTTMTFIRIGDT
jgi:hypothetical protein